MTGNLRPISDLYLSCTVIRVVLTILPESCTNVHWVWVWGFRMRKTFFVVSQTERGTCSTCLLCCAPLQFSCVASVTGQVYSVFRNTLQGQVAILLESSFHFILHPSKGAIWTWPLKLCGCCLQHARPELWCTGELLGCLWLRHNPYHSFPAFLLNGSVAPVPSLH